MHENLLVLLIPRVHLVPVKCQVSLDWRSAAQRLEVAPDCIVGRALTHSHRPVRGDSLIRTGCSSLRWLKQVHAYVVLWEVVRRQPLRLAHEHHAAAVGDGFAAEHHPYPARAWFKRHRMMLIAGWVCDVRLRPFLGSHAFSLVQMQLGRRRLIEETPEAPAVSPTAAPRILVHL